jgi:ubiquinone/menaquinone biosynthesis C-methylase UbiE
MMNEIEKNINTYSDSKVVRHYAEYSTALQAPEGTIFKVLHPQLNRMRMLDIGVGGGRTTSFFAPLVKTYTGIDFSEGMINACKKKFNTVFPMAQFETKDVRDLKDYPSGSFDFVFFSFNGLDNISHEERILVLKEIKRICSPDGYFCFSSHNLQYLPLFFSIRFRLHPIKFLRSVVNRKKLLLQNQEQIKNIPTADHLTIFDDVYDFGLFTYYSKPAYQIKQLEDAGFHSVQLFELEEGKNISVKESYDNNVDPWVYYLCRS